MRKIEFRGRLACGIFIYGNLFINDKGHAYITTDDGVKYPIDLETVGQFTGLRDKHGIEIFEGDILKQWIPSMWKGKHGHWQYGEVTWKQSDRGLVRGRKILDDVEFELYNGVHTVWFQDKVEIAGNIFENKNLLTKKGKNG